MEDEVLISWQINLEYEISEEYHVRGKHECNSPMHGEKYFAVYLLAKNKHEDAPDPPMHFHACIYRWEDSGTSSVCASNARHEVLGFHITIINDHLLPSYTGKWIQVCKSSLVRMPRKIQRLVSRINPILEGLFPEGELLSEQDTRFRMVKRLAPELGIPQRCRKFHNGYAKVTDWGFFDR